MLWRPNKHPEPIGGRILTHARKFGVANPKGPYFDRVFNRQETERQVDLSRNLVGQGVNQMMFPNGISPDGYSSFTPLIGISDKNYDPETVHNSIAENQANLYWKKNVERAMKYNTVAGRSEVNESLIQICNEAVYEDENDEICVLQISKDSGIGEGTQTRMHRIFRRTVLTEFLNFYDDGDKYMHYLLVHGRLFFEVAYDENSGLIKGVQMLPEENMIIVVQDNLIIGYRQMLTGAISMKTGGKNYIDYSPNQILYASLGMNGPGGLNDPRSILEPAIKPYNQLNTIEDSVVMYRILWGSEKLVLKVDTSGMPKDKAEKFMKDQAKIFSRKIDYNSLTGEVTNFGKVIGLSEHFIIGLSQGRTGSSIERMQGGEQLGNIDDLKFFKRNLVNSLMVPPGRITCLAGDSQNYTQGKIGEVTVAEVSFARLIQKYQRPMRSILLKLFLMVLDTDRKIADRYKVPMNFRIKFKKANGFNDFIGAEVLNTRLGIFGQMMQHTASKDNPNGVLAKEFCLRRGLGLNDADYLENKEYLKKEKAEEMGEAVPAEAGAGGGEGGGMEGGMGGGFPGM